MSKQQVEGILLIDKPKDKTSFSLVGRLRKILNVKKIGHAGTLDPFATGVMVMLVGRNYTKLSDQFLNEDKEYVAELKLGEATNSFDSEGEITDTSDYIPTLEEVKEVIAKFQGEIKQIPPMFSAKKINGKKLYELARKGISVEREPVTLCVETHLVSYNYPSLIIHVTCSKGTYIRSIANDMGELLGTKAHLINLQRTRSGSYRLQECIDGKKLFAENPSSEEIIPNLQPLFT